MENNENILQGDHTACPLMGHHEVEICLPITIKPYAKTGPIKTKCCGAAVIRPGVKSCEGIKDGECCFTITQKLRVDIPIVFGAKSMTGDSYVCCSKHDTDFCEEKLVEDYEEDEEEAE